MPRRANAGVRGLFFLWLLFLSLGSRYHYMMSGGNEISFLSFFLQHRRTWLKTLRGPGEQLWETRDVLISIVVQLTGKTFQSITNSTCGGKVIELLLFELLTINVRPLFLTMLGTKIQLGEWFSLIRKTSLYSNHPLNQFKQFLFFLSRSYPNLWFVASLLTGRVMTFAI